MLRFARGWRAPSLACRRGPALPDATCLCRCEAITAGALREAAGYGGAEANRAKSLSRVGMGRCQGRYCALAAAEVIAAHAGIAVREVGRLRGQAPVRPWPMGVRRADAQAGSAERARSIRQQSSSPERRRNSRPRGRWVIEPGPQMIAGTPAAWKRPASVP
ncbi:MAG: (2Fe-2S)-binding protein [Amaricoccus sp.]